MLQRLEERDGSGNLVARYTYAPGYIDAVAVQERDLNSDSDFADTNEVVYYHQNTLYSVMALSDASGNVVERYRYDAYGAVTVLDPDGSADADGLSDVENPYTFTGRRLDLESGLMQYRNRYYSPALGRFISHDPAGCTDSYNLYAYVGNAPVRFLDPMGLVRWLQVVPRLEVSGGWLRITVDYKEGRVRDRGRLRDIGDWQLQVKVPWLGGQQQPDPDGEDCQGGQRNFSFTCPGGSPTFCKFLQNAAAFATFGFVDAGAIYEGGWCTGCQVKCKRKCRDWWLEGCLKSTLTECYRACIEEGNRCRGRAGSCLMQYSVTL